MQIEELVQIYLKRLNNTTSKKQELKKIINEIDRLTYEETGKPISKNDKKHILELLKKTIPIRGSATARSNGAGQVILGEVIGYLQQNKVFAQDNSEFLELLTKAIEELGG